MTVKKEQDDHSIGRWRLVQSSWFFRRWIKALEVNLQGKTNTHQMDKSMISLANSASRFAVHLVLSLVFVSIVFVGCDTSSLEQEADEIVVTLDHVSEGVKAGKAMLTDSVLGHDEVVGVAISRSESGDESILVFVKSPEETWNNNKKAILPSEANGFPVRTIVTGEFKVPGPTSSQGSSEELGAMEFDRPVPIGSSTGPASGRTGTIGARLTDGSSVYSLSNNHIYATENQLSAGTPVMQPGIFDGGQEGVHDIGTLSNYVPINFDGSCSNTVDAAIALSSATMLSNQTPADGYGIPKNKLLVPEVGQEVKKYGRTSGMTFGKIIAVDATVEVSYPSGIACFSNQILVSPGEFSTGGDSGSLVVTHDGDQESKNNRPVGLVFAGSESFSVANDIANVLEAFSMTVDGDKSLGNFGDNNDNGSNSSNGSNGSNGNNGNNGGSNGNDGDPVTAWPQGMGEVLVRVEDSSGTLVGGVTICAWQSATNSTCASSASSALEGNYNWTSDTNNHGSTSISVPSATKTIYSSPRSTNALYHYWTSGDQDMNVKFIVTNTTTNEGYFSNLNVTGTPDAELASVDITNVVVGSPRRAESGIDIEWDAEWDGSGWWPSWVGGHFDATVSIMDGATTLVTLNAAAGFADGDGSVTWTPTAVYSDLHAKVQENDTEGSATSSTFDVESPITFSISGPSILEQGVQGTWSITPSGGTTPYTYDWDYLLMCSSQGLVIYAEECGTWYQGGTSSSWSKSLSGDQFDLKIRVTATDSDNPAYSTTKEKIVDIVDEL